VSCQAQVRIYQWGRQGLIKKCYSNNLNRGLWELPSDHTTDIPQIAVGSIVSLRRLTGFDKPGGPSRLVDGNSGGPMQR
jgi:hypothetical protein